MLSNPNTILITGVAGFIGYHVAKRLLDLEYHIVGIDNLNTYYDQDLKITRLADLEDRHNFDFFNIDITDSSELMKCFKRHYPKIVIHLAAQAGVRYSIESPAEYISSNLVGFFNLLECCKNYNPENILYASSSSVYGMHKTTPFSTHLKTDGPSSLYAATKKSNELMAYSYSHLYDLSIIGMRFFTVYGPFGRPDMAYFKFTKAIYEDKPIQIYNNGNMERDLTYIDDVVFAIERLMNLTIEKSDCSHYHSTSMHKVVNIGNNSPVKLLKLIELLEDSIGKRAIRELTSMQPGDVEITYADAEDLVKLIGFSPTTKIETGISKFVEWYKNYYINR